MSLLSLSTDISIFRVHPTLPAYQGYHIPHPPPGQPYLVYLVVYTTKIHL